MAQCSSIAAIALTACGKLTKAGIQKLYMMAVADLAVATASTDQSYYVKSAANLITEIGQKSGKNFVEIGFLPAKAGVTAPITINDNGTGFVQSKLELTLMGNTQENQTFVESLINNPVAILFKANTGDFYAFGLSGQVKLSGGEQSFGTAAGDDYGYKVTLEGAEETFISRVDPTIISGLLS